jgi:NADH:ubiquinone oxidoreductase subunit 6 (subunit J)
MMNERPLGIVIFLVGAVGAVISALANPLGIGEDEVFGWLQITGVIVGAVLALLGLAIAMSWVPYPGRPADTVSAGTQNTTIVEDRPPHEPTR